MWFSGNIPDAIASAKSQDALLLVFLADESDSSKMVKSMLEGAELSGQFSNPKQFVALKLDKDTTPFRQFSEIYPVVCIPSIFLIGRNGTPLEVIGGAVDASFMKEKIMGALALHKGKEVASGEGSHPVPSQDSSGEANSSEGASAQISADGSGEMDQGASDSTGSECRSVEERVEHTKKLLELRREQKRQEELEKEKEKERERRRTGQELQKFREKQEEEERMKAAAENKKDRDEERMARERILQQIQQDRAERSVRWSAEKSAKMEAQESRQKEEANRKWKEEQERLAASSSVARIQFRLPDGSQRVHDFDPDATLQEAWDWAKGNISLPYSRFTLSTLYPRRQFENEEFSSTLRDLLLVPTAVLLILPATVGTRDVRASGDGGSSVASLRSLFWTICSPLVAVFNMLMVLLSSFLPSSSPPSRPLPPPNSSTPPPSASALPSRPSGSSGLILTVVCSLLLPLEFSSLNPSVKWEMSSGDGDGLQIKKEEIDDKEKEEESKHFQRIVNAFQYYRIHCLERVNHTLSHLLSLNLRHQEMLTKYREHLTCVRSCIEHNAKIVDLIVADAKYLYVNAAHETIRSCNPKQASMADMDKVQSTLKQFVRDWSSLGQEERNACYGPILRALVHAFPPDEVPAGSVRVLVPGAGLGRLAFEIASLGFECQGNEFSLFMLLASNFVLNKCSGVDMYTLYPFVHQYINNLNATDQVQAIKFPDVNPSSISLETEFSMAAGDFLNDNGKYCNRILSPGGIWINLGPLLYHYADIPGEVSIEPAYDLLHDLILACGFTFLVVQEEDTDVLTTYAQNPYSMLKSEYRCVFSVCLKPKEDSSSIGA
ncbi:unnamed protein product [Darwinula stevensoni]|uniref:UBX domain-containing protein 4 n=1 Tax=Darwinula stevensoni TaxID=69355 RepID=A0A7R8X2F4_9CRUS|nr:unnamed protein product [Darwinula stevensoni]CAG0881387.1 unnamed protein product [Darwinula stevensoni]